MEDGTAITEKDLAKILQLHALWDETRGKRGKFANLKRANLEDADLEAANLTSANLEGANLREANLAGANLDRSQLARANLTGAILDWASLRGADLREANLRHSYPREADLSRANLEKADLQEASLGGANLQGAFLAEADMESAFLEGANLEGANLEGAKLQRVNMQEVNLQRAKLKRATLEGAELSLANLAGVDFEPKPGFAATTPSLAAAKGLAKLSFNSSSHALGELRNSFKISGMREQERQVTYAIRHTQVVKYLKESWWESGLSYVAFDWTCTWGLAPFRPLGIMLLLLCFPFGLFYFLFAFPARLPDDGKDGIWQVWSDDALYRDPEKDKTSPLQPASGLAMLGYGLYFSLLSAFHIGWRDLNVGAWISRISRREYTLRATGWVRVVSGVQSLISVYLLALCILSYFGRPFE
jgi:uncharacterized protein YjbI with pentapeptide repeats